MLALGKRYLLRHKLLVVLYIAAYLLGHSVLPAAVGLYAQQISNGIPVAGLEVSGGGGANPKIAQARQAPAQMADHSGLWRAYGLWLAATFQLRYRGSGRQSQQCDSPGLVCRNLAKAFLVLS
jgi:hypothetical protein